MKLNTSDFSLNRKILTATEEKVIYEEEKSGLSETWDALSSKYTLEMENKDTKQSLEIKAQNILKDVKVEVDTFMSTLNLIEKDIIKASPVKERKKEYINFKETMINSCIKILDKGLEACMEANKRIEELDNVLFEGIEGPRTLSMFGVPFKKIDNELRIYFTKNEYAVINSKNQLKYPSHWKPMGLVVTFRFENNSFVKIFPPTVHKNEIMNIKEYFKEENLVIKRSKHNMSYEISRNTQDMASSGDSSYISKRLDLLCKSILDIVRSKKEVEEEIFEYINIYISNIYIKNLLSSLESYQVINLTGNILLDDFPDEFIIVSDKKYKFKRKKYSFSIFENEEWVVVKF